MEHLTPASPKLSPIPRTFQLSEYGNSTGMTRKNNVPRVKESTTRSTIQPAALVRPKFARERADNSVWSRLNLLARSRLHIQNHASGTLFHPVRISNSQGCRRSSDRLSNEYLAKRTSSFRSKVGRATHVTR